MRIGSVGIETLVGHFIDHIGTVGENFFFHAVEIVANDHSFEFNAKFIGKLTSFCEELKAHVGHMPVLKLAIYYEIVIISHVIKN